MRELSELLETGVYESFKPEKQVTIKELLGELGLEGKYFGILVNGRKAGEDYRLKETDHVVILPHIAGGEDIPLYGNPSFFCNPECGSCKLSKPVKKKTYSRLLFRRKKRNNRG